MHPFVLQARAASNARTHDLTLRGRKLLFHLLLAQGISVHTRVVWGQRGHAEPASSQVPCVRSVHGRRPSRGYYHHALYARLLFQMLQPTRALGHAQLPRMSGPHSIGEDHLLLTVRIT